MDRKLKGHYDKECKFLSPSRAALLSHHPCSGILNVWMKVLNVLAVVGVIEQLRLQAAAVAVAQVVAHWITEREVRSSIPTGTRALSISSLSYLYQSVVCPLKGPLGRCNTTDFNLPTKMKA